VLTVKQGAFYDGDQPVFLYGAECHYFRLEPDQWVQRLQMVKAAGCNLVSTYIPWLWHEPLQYQQDFVGSTHPRRNLVRFLELCADLGMRVMVRPGPYVMSELRNEGIPEWVFQRYPEVVAQQPSGQPHPARVISYLHPTFLTVVKRWYDGVLAVMAPFWADRGGPIEILQLDNEIGMLHWVTQCGDHHPLTLRRFSEAVSPSASGTGIDHGWSRLVECSEPSVNGDIARHFEWALFNRQEMADYALHLQTLARECGCGALCAINVHGFKDFSIYSRGTDYPIGVSQLLKAAKLTGALVAGDFYPGHITYDNYHDVVLATAITAAMGGADKPIFSAEFQSGRLSDRPTVSAHDLDLLTRLCVAHGMNALNYYMFCAGDNPEDIGLFGPRHEWQAPIASDGTPRSSYAAATRLGRLFADWGSSLVATSLVHDTTIGFYAPYYMTEEACPDSPEVRQMISELSHVREHLHFDGLWRQLVASNVSVGVLDLFETGPIAPGKYGSLWVATTTWMDAATQRALLDYAAAGGMLVIGPELPTRDLTGAPCTILADALGMNVKQRLTGYQQVNLMDTDGVFTRHCAVVHTPSDVQVLGHMKGDASQVVAFGRDTGEGRVVFVGVGLTHEFDYQTGVMLKLVRYCGIEPQLTVSHPRAVASLRSGPEVSFLSLVNVLDEDIETTVELRGQPLFDGHPVGIARQSGLLLALGHASENGPVIRYCTSEYRMNARSHDRIELAVRIHRFQVILGVEDGWIMVDCDATWSRDAATGAYRIRPLEGAPEREEYEVNVALQAVAVASGV